MSATDNITAEETTRQTEAFLERILESTAGAFNIFTMYIGDRLGFYRALAESGPSTCAELATRTGTNERYAREWLEQQTIAGILAVDDVDLAPETRRFSLPPAHAEVLVERDSLNYLAPLARMVVAAGHPMESILQAYRNGGGVPYRDYGPEFREGQAEINRAMFLKQLGTEYIPSIPDIHTRLQRDPSARIADIGCGAGWSSIGIASAYPKVRVDGYDLDQPSITLAQANADTAGLNGRVKFQVRDAGDPTLAGRYDLVTAFECVHDMSEPVKALKTMFNLVVDNGTVIVMDERVGDSFTAKGNEVEWMMYGWSVLHCLPVGMADQPSVATGTVMRTDTLRKYAEQAGFCDVEVLPIDNFFFRFYRLKTRCAA